MATKTITVRESAYEAVKSMKEPGESFSDMFLRISKKKPLSAFFGILSGKAGEEFEKAILEARKRRNKVHKERMNKVIEALQE